MSRRKRKKRRKVEKEVVVKEPIKKWIVRSVKEEFSGKLGKAKLFIFLFILTLYIAFLIIMYRGWIEAGMPLGR